MEILQRIRNNFAFFQFIMFRISCQRTLVTKKIESFDKLRLFLAYFPKDKGAFAFMMSVCPTDP